MTSEAKTTLNLKYTLKPGTRDAMLAELKTVLDLCAQEPEFITAVLQETPERPDEMILFEIWRGTHEDFIRVQGPKPYRKEYLASSKQYVAAVDAIFSVPFREWGTQLLTK
jgi:quinol monooxygenase YgiN